MFDVTSEDSYKQVFSEAPLVSSSGTLWKSIGLNYHRLPDTHEIPEICLTQHMVVIRTQVSSSLKFERKVDGRWRNEPQKPGYVMLIPANVPVSVRWSQQADEELEALDLYLDPALVAAIAHESINPDRVELVTHFAQPDPTIEHLGLTLKAELEAGCPGGRLFGESLATALAIQLLNKYGVSSPTLHNHEGGLSQRKLKQSIDYIHDHLGQDVRLDSLAAVVGMSQYYFARMFKQSMGTSPHQYLLQCRLERAKQLLRQEDIAIAQIAQACGFKSPSHFTKHFRDYTGITPKAYRQR
jgi:AraC family transcriptional regulator